YACDDGKGEIARWDPRTGDVSTYARGAGGRDLDCPNVAAFDANGRLYVTCSGEAGRPEIVRIPPGGGEAQTWTAAVPASPNGALITPEGDALVVVEAQAQRLVRVPVLSGGGAGTPAVIAALGDTDPDGVGLDANGDYWVTLYRP